MWAQSRMLIEVMTLGKAMCLFYAWRAASIMSPQASKTLLESQLSRMCCQMFSPGLSSGKREGSRIKVMFLGTLKLEGSCAIGSVRPEAKLTIARYGRMTSPCPQRAIAMTVLFVPTSPTA